MNCKSFSILALLGIFLLAADKPQDTGSADREKLQGTWQFVLAAQGNTDKTDDMKLCRLTVDGDKFTVKDDSQPMIDGTFKIDSTQSPPQIDWMVIKDQNNDEHNGKKSLAIYQLTGDKLKMCAADAGQPKRPGGFEVANTDFMLFVLERVKK
jgi:uncharacterized protein (TIGR03067 family)